VVIGSVLTLLIVYRCDVPHESSEGNHPIVAIQGASAVPSPGHFKGRNEMPLPLLGAAHFLLETKELRTGMIASE